MYHDIRMSGRVWSQIHIPGVRNLDIESWRSTLALTAIVVDV